MKKLIRLLVLVVCLAFFVFLIVKQWDALAVLDWHVDGYLFSVSLLLLALIFYLDALGWHFILHSYGLSIKYKHSARIWIYSSFTRYIPGIVWAYVSRVTLSAEHGVDKMHCVRSIMHESLLLAITAMIVGVPAIKVLLGVEALIGLSSPVFDSLLVMMLLSGIAVVALFVVSRYLNNLLPQRIGVMFDGVKVQTLASSMVLTLYYICFWGAFSAVFFIFYASLFGLDGVGLETILFVASAFSVSFFIGFVASVSPGGLGIREATMFGLLSTQLPLPEATVLSLGSRLWLMLGELMALGSMAIFSALTKSRDS